MKLNKLSRQSIKSLEQSDKVTVLSAKHMDLISGGIGSCFHFPDDGDSTYCKGYVGSETCTWVPVE